MPEFGAAQTSERTLRREPLSVRRIARAALGLLDTGGMAAVTMRAVAAQLNVEAMSLYRYVDNRDRMLDAVIDAVVDELADDPQLEMSPSGAWEDWLAGMARAVRRYSRAHPRAFPLIATHPSEIPWLNPPLRSARWVEALLSGLEGERFSDDEALFAYRVFNTFLLGHLLLETAALVHSLGSGQPDHADGRQQPPANGASVPALTDASEYPTIARLAEGLAEDRWDREFETGLSDMIDRVLRFRETSSAAR